MSVRTAVHRQAAVHSSNRAAHAMSVHEPLGVIAVANEWAVDLYSLHDSRAGEHISAAAGPFGGGGNGNGNGHGHDGQRGENQAPAAVACTFPFLGAVQLRDDAAYDFDQSSMLRNPRGATAVAFCQQSAVAHAALLVTGCSDGVVLVHRLDPRETLDPLAPRLAVTFVFYLRLSTLNHAVRSLVFHPQATQTCVALAAHDNRLHIVDTRPPGLLDAGHGPAPHLASTQRQSVGRLEDHMYPVTACTFSADGSRMATAQEDGAVYVWNVEYVPFGQPHEGITCRLVHRINALSRRAPVPVSLQWLVLFEREPVAATHMAPVVALAAACGDGSTAVFCLDPDGQRAPELLRSYPPKKNALAKKQTPRPAASSPMKKTQSGGGSSSSSSGNTKASSSTPKKPLQQPEQVHADLSASSFSSVMSPPAAWRHVGLGSRAPDNVFTREAVSFREDAYVVLAHQDGTVRLWPLTEMREPQGDHRLIEDATQALPDLSEWLLMARAQLVGKQIKGIHMLTATRSEWLGEMLGSGLVAVILTEAGLHAVHFYEAGLADVLRYKIQAQGGPVTPGHGARRPMPALAAAHDEVPETPILRVDADGSIDEHPAQPAHPARTVHVNTTSTTSATPTLADRYAMQPLTSPKARPARSPVMHSTRHGHTHGGQGQERPEPAAQHLWDHRPHDRILSPLANQQQQQQPSKRHGNVHPHEVMERVAALQARVGSMETHLVALSNTFKLFTEDMQKQMDSVLTFVREMEHRK